MLKVITTSILLSCGTIFAQTPGALSETDRQLSLDRLKEIKESAIEDVDSRHSTALSAFRAAMSSDASTHELYLKCVEKVLFQTEAKKKEDFRRWRKNHKDRRDSSEFRRALRHQLRWLVLVLEVSQSPKDLQPFKGRAMEQLNNVLSDYEKVKGSEAVLRESVLGTVFARAYGVGNLKAGKFPKAPLNLSELYEAVVFPPLRSIDRVSDLRAAWKNRIKYEGRLIKEWGQEGVRGRRPQFEKWYLNDRLDLLWTMEQDIYRIGDQRSATRTMLEFLERNVNHAKAKTWISQLEALLKGDQTPAPKKAPKPATSAKEG